ncbi:MAG: Uma2 family endonuclease [Planctomycetales bacterium]|nr:Uma2 family endonuclease [Planctomycetales bacterium]
MSTEIRKLTYSDYVCFPDNGKRHEIIGGDHYMNPVPCTYHQYVSRRLQFQLYSKIELAELGCVIYAPVDVQLTESDIVQPDIVVVLKNNRIITPTKVKGAPEHLIEILSPSTETNDKSLKRNLYERTGVGEYWIVDPFEQTITQLVLENGCYVQKEREGNRVAVTYLPDVDVDLDQVW